MKLFGSKKKKHACCHCGSSCTCKETGVKILGTGCAKCNALERAAVEALEELGMEKEVEHVTDFSRIASYGVMSTPALVIDDKVVSAGEVLTKDEVIEILRKVR